MELERLTPAEQVELLALMEQQAQEPAPERLTDDRPSFDELLAELRDEYAAKSADPSAFRTAWDRHEEATRQHFEKLEAENPPPLQGNELVSDPVGAWFLATIEKAHELAEVDGFRDPSAKPTPPPAPPDPLGAALRASLPRPTWVDSEETPCVRVVAARIGSEPLGARVTSSGSVRTGVQGQDSGAAASAGEFIGRDCLVRGWCERGDVGALAGGCLGPRAWRR